MRWERDFSSLVGREGGYEWGVFGVRVYRNWGGGEGDGGGMGEEG